MTPRNYEPLQQIVQSFAVQVTYNASAPPKRELLEDEQINFNIGGTLAFTLAWNWRLRGLLSRPFDLFV